MSYSYNILPEEINVVSLKISILTLENPEFGEFNGLVILKSYSLLFNILFSF